MPATSPTLHKHAVLARILIHLREKATAFRVIDTHAGAGRYDLAGDEANRTGEWREGIARRAGRAARAAVARAAGALSRCARRLRSRAAGGLSRLPGDRARAHAAAGPADRLRVGAGRRDGARRAACPRQARQGDPHRRLDRADRLCAAQGAARARADRPRTSSSRTSFAQAAERLLAAHRRWPTGIFMLWYPLKEPAGPAASPSGSPPPAFRTCCAANCGPAPPPPSGWPAAAWW